MFFVSSGFGTKVSNSSVRSPGVSVCVVDCGIYPRPRAAKRLHYAVGGPGWHRAYFPDGRSAVADI